LKAILAERIGGTSMRFQILLERPAAFAVRQVDEFQGLYLRLVLEMCSFVLRIGALRWVAGKASISSSTVMALMLVMLSRMLRHSDMKISRTADVASYQNMPAQQWAPAS
jgi:hypothetical protein